MMAARAIPADVSNGDVANVVQAVSAVDGGADHGRFGGTGGAVGPENVRERQEIVAGVSGEVFDENVVASLAQIESVLVEDGFRLAVNGPVPRGGEVDIADFSVGAALE